MINKQELIDKLQYSSRYNGPVPEWVINAIRATEDPTEHVEMIVDYMTDGTDYQYYDNHGLLIRCRDCVHHEKGRCMRFTCGVWTPDSHYCGWGQKRDG